MQLKLRKRRGLTLMGFLLVALLVAACGSAAKSSSTATGTNASDSSTSAHTTLSVMKGSAGTHLVGANGRTVYLWEGDSMNKSHCSSSCLSVWPAVTVAGKPTAGHGVNASAIATIKTDGKKQVTYEGHPLYYYAADSGAGSTSGQGSDGFGAKWWIVSPAGKAITTSTSAPAPTTSTSSAPTSTSTGSSGGSSWG